MLIYEHYNDEGDLVGTYDVYYKISPFTPVKLTGHPESWHDAEGGDMEDLEVLDENGKDITNTLPLTTIKDIEAKCYEDVENFEPSYDY